MISGLVEEIGTGEHLNVKENFFKNALNEETEVDSFLRYNRNRVAGFEKERLEWLKRYEMVRPKPDEDHKLEWDLRKFNDDIALLQKELSDKRMQLFEERQLLLKSQAEHNQLTKKANIDNKVAQTLVNHCNPVEQKVIYSKGSKPTVMTKYVNNDLNLEFNRAEGHKKSRVERILDKERVFRTVVVDGVDLKGSTNRGEGELDDSQAREETELDREIRVVNENISILRDELETSERTYNLRVLDVMNRLDELSESELKNDRLICDLNKEILKQRIAFEQKEFELQNENETTRRLNVLVANKLAELEYSLSKERRDIHMSIERKADKKTASLKKAFRENENEIDRLKREYKKVQSEDFAKVKALETEITQLKDKVKKEAELKTLKSEATSAYTHFAAILEVLASRNDISEAEKHQRLENFRSIYQKPAKKLGNARVKRSQSKGKTKTRARLYEPEEEDDNISDMPVKDPPSKSSRREKIV